MIFRAARVTKAELARVTGWHVRPAGLCREERCVPFASRDDAVDLGAVANAVGAPLVHDADHGLWALGAEAGGRALASAVAPDFELPDAQGRIFRLATLRGQKVLLVAWASW